MKIRRVHDDRSLNDLAVDGVDIFLLSLAEEEIELSELTQISPRNALECLERVLKLGRLGLLRLRFDLHEERLLARGCDEGAAQTLLDNATTLRPPPAERGARQGPECVHNPRVSLISETTQPRTGIRSRPAPPAHGARGKSVR